MFSLRQPTSFEQSIKKSRFLALAAAIADEDEARAKLSALADAGANHNCWAWRIGQTYRFNDDGEPGGTAGKPILQAIDGQSFDRVLVVVSRWFGGVLLGTGGLMRAYGGTAAACLRAADRVEVVPMVAAIASIGFSDLALAKARLLSIAGLSVVAEMFTEDGAVLSLSIPEGQADRAAALVADITNGRVQLDFGSVGNPDTLAGAAP
ncbi:MULTISPECIES: IMPACT family protein [Rhizobium]|uniref:IMPACT family protein n=1 Tax=Rhizobium rhododendri TaxID=2506430 RepID=A0ABY8IN89_9HYPH|nr:MULTISPECIES: YigZ family protein [Rhizobium]MBZ5759938.1 IMPACT family protein [Rhizobium sp. VS19-DR96]MBZ5766581.1 IMPACT family protein [Rhizobium sp. VS19-DR129.2]MBZ5774076.1 IMPACT family protein [Rhizobium sp. VS19-DRK62.2]MBZ5785148.1 IMPACT family protein [Rhizobium sp. VS19-DR121]MBZ5802747.1 IMPACT family protein [Rhizobium sp. VS19-DR181]